MKIAVKSRLDTLLQARGIVESREQARGLILSGAVWVDGQRRDKAGVQVASDAEISVQGDRCPYVGRGGLKLEGALDHFGIDVSEAVAFDVGASTGGFTDCLLQRGAKKVYAVDVGYGQIAWKLRIDPRVVLIERQNIRTMPKETIGEPVDWIVIDVSFISLEKVIPCVVPHLREGGGLLALIKPQFEVGYGEVGAGGIVRDAAQHQQVVDRICGQAGGWGLQTRGTVPSPILGKEGNREFFIYMIGAHVAPSSGKAR
jgi:23S rRNA (cytidine1920-2'-O)/16S rRNA (cytidine1409-2'-O)-methyltransferase